MMDLRQHKDQRTLPSSRMEMYLEFNNCWQNHILFTEHLFEANQEAINMSLEQRAPQLQLIWNHPGKIILLVLHSSVLMLSDVEILMIDKVYSCSPSLG
ncbi:hypothetical protein SLE2022_214710 [Rubroshorea leprosula]